jgi:peroxin-7
VGDRTIATLWDKMALSCRLHTELNGYSVAWSPFHQSLLAVGTAQYFGVIGNGQQLVYDLSPEIHAGGPPRPLAVFNTPDGVYDSCWSELDPNHLLSATGDGTLSLWDIRKQNQIDETAQMPISEFREHTAEVYSIDWNLVGKHNFVSGAWDNTVKLWDPLRLNGPSIRTFAEHTSCVYSTRCSPYHDEMFASSSGDCHVKVWDAHSPKSAVSFKAHDYEVLTMDWNRYNENILLTGSVDRSVRVWDLRSLGSPLYSFVGHEFAVRRVKCSPHSETKFMTASYDMSVCLWDYDRANNESDYSDAIVERYDHHSEFVIGIDFNLFIEDLMASCSWDESVQVWQFGEKPHAR